MASISNDRCVSAPSSSATWPVIKAVKVVSGTGKMPSGGRASCASTASRVTRRLQMGQTLEEPLVYIVSGVAGKLGDVLCYLGPDFFLVDVSPIPEYFSPLCVFDYDNQAGRAAPGAGR